MNEAIWREERYCLKEKITALKARVAELEPVVTAAVATRRGELAWIEAARGDRCPPVEVSSKFKNARRAFEAARDAYMAAHPLAKAQDGGAA